MIGTTLIYLYITMVLQYFVYTNVYITRPVSINKFLSNNPMSRHTFKFFSAIFP